MALVLDWARRRRRARQFEGRREGGRVRQAGRQQNQLDEKHVEAHVMLSRIEAQVCVCVRGGR